jgi:hypothetical protein
VLLSALTKIAAAGKVAAKSGTSLTSTATIWRASGVDFQREMFGETVCEVQRIQIDDCGRYGGEEPFSRLWRMHGPNSAKSLLMTLVNAPSARGDRPQVA